MLLPHADSPIESLHIDFRLFRDLQNVISLRRWESIVTHGELGEYGHALHKIIYKVVSHIITTSNPEALPRGLYTFDRVPSTLRNDTFLKVRQSLLQRIYGRSADTWEIMNWYAPVKRDLTSIPVQDVSDLRLCIPLGTRM